MPRSISKVISGALYFTSSVLYLSAAYGDFLDDHLSTAKIVAGSLMIAGNLVWMSASIFDMCSGSGLCNRLTDEEADNEDNEITPDIENQLEELQQMKAHGGSTASIVRSLNFNGASLKKSPSGRHLNLELEIEVDSEEDKHFNVVVLPHVSLVKRKQDEELAHQRASGDEKISDENKQVEEKAYSLENASVVNLR